MDPARAARALDSWFSRNGRDLPWRQTHEPYHVLVSEFILQQTRMETGLRYFERFIARFPTLESLARARLESVLRLWSGLGYYSRARNLHAAAREILKRHGGVIPAEVGTLELLPGIGAYTAGAIASIAYDRPEPALDGNQLRVLGRLHGEDASSRDGRRNIEARARALLVHGSPRALNQAIMDLGSSACGPRDPDCSACPLRKGCAWSAGRRPRRRSPLRAPRARTESWEVHLHSRRGRIWLERPKAEGLLAGLWLPPLRRARGRIASPDLVHKFSHVAWRLRIVSKRSRPRGRGRWISRDDLQELPHSALTRAIVLRVADL